MVPLQLQFHINVNYSIYKMYKDICGSDIIIKGTQKLQMVGKPKTEAKAAVTLLGHCLFFFLFISALFSCYSIAFN